MKVQLIGHDEKYALEQSLLTLFPDERPLYGTVEPGDARWAVVRMHEENGSVCVTTELGFDGTRAAGSHACPLSGTEYEREGQRRHCLGLSFFRAASELLDIHPAWGSLTGVRPTKVALSLLREGGRSYAERELADTYFVTPERIRLAIECADAGIKAAAALEPKDISLYVGIPFCPTRCAYCSFVAQSVEKSFALVEPYLDALCIEIAAAGQLVRDLGLNIRSFYMGGGTPTTLTAPELDRLLADTKACFDLSACREFTVEAGRPDTVTEEKLAVLVSHGVNRVSVNPQTMSDEVLETIGRRHTAAEVREAVAMVKRFPQLAFNMDLIAGLPGDTPESFSDTVREVIALGAENITVHTLALKKGSRFLTEGTALPDGRAVGEMLGAAREKLEAAGYAPYYLYRQKFMSGSFENVGWTKPGYENLYNICIMEELCGILAVGAGGSTKLTAPGGVVKRLMAPKYPREYMERIAQICAEKDEIVRFYKSEPKGKN